MDLSSDELGDVDESGSQKTTKTEQKKDEENTEKNENKDKDKEKNTKNGGQQESF